MAYNASSRKSPVVYDLWQSPFYYEEGRYKFFFSTVKHLEKFTENVRAKELWLTDSMSRRFHLHVDCTDLADFQLYMQIEGRGFLVYDNLTEAWIHSPENIYFGVVVC